MKVCASYMKSVAFLKLVHCKMQLVMHTQHTRFHLFNLTNMSRGDSLRVVVSTCNMNQWAMDFDGNLSKIMQSISIAKAQLDGRYAMFSRLEFGIFYD